MFTVCRAARAAVNDNVFFFHHRTMPKKELFPHKLRSGCKKVQQKTVFHGIIHLPSPNEIMRISILNTRLSPSDVAFCPTKNDAPSLIHPLIRPLSMPVSSVTATNDFFSSVLQTSRFNLIRNENEREREDSEKNLSKVQMRKMKSEEL